MESYSFPHKKSICTSKRLKNIKICPKISKNGHKAAEDLIPEQEETGFDTSDDDDDQVPDSLLSSSSGLNWLTQALPKSSSSPTSPVSPVSPVSPTSPKTPVSPVSLTSSNSPTVLPSSLHSYTPFDPLYLHTSERERLDNFDFNSIAQNQRVSPSYNPGISASSLSIPLKKLSCHGSPTTSHRPTCSRQISSTTANRSPFRRSGSATLRQTSVADSSQTALCSSESNKRNSYSRQASVSSKNSLFDYNDSISIGSPLSTYSSGQVFKRGSRAAINGNKLGHRRSFSRSSTITSIELETFSTKKSLNEIQIEDPPNNNNTDSNLEHSDNCDRPHKSHDNLEEYTYNRYTYDNDSYVKQLANLDFESSIKLRNNYDSDICVNATKHTDEKLSTPRVFYILENPIASLIDLDIVDELK